MKTHLTKKSTEKAHQMAVAHTKNTKGIILEDNRSKTIIQQKNNTKLPTNLKSSIENFPVQLQEIAQLAKGKNSKHNRKKLALDKRMGVGARPAIWKNTPKALSGGDAKKALENTNRNNHASRHLTDAGKLGAWSADTEEKFKQIIEPILKSPFRSFFYNLRGEECKGYISSSKITALVYNGSGLIATTYVASAEQLKQWGLENDF